MFVAMLTKLIAIKMSNIFLQLFFIKYSSTILSAGRAEPLEPDLLALNNEAFMRAFCHWKRYSHQAVRAAAACACKMRMALVLGAVVSQFKMPGPFVHKGLMHQPDVQKAFECPIDCNFIEPLLAQKAGNLVLAERLTGRHQDNQDIDPTTRTVEFCGLQHLTGFYFQIQLCHFSLPFLP
jgi:hypothetical protein